jgi:NDP-sugar pyrophosphorylase family protein
MERHCLVLAGGLGTRLQTVTKNLLPKALVSVANRPFLYYKLVSLKRMGVTHVWILAGALGEQIESYVQSLQEPDMEIRVEHDGMRLLGTAGAINKLVPKLPSQFWVTYGDTYVMADLAGAELCDAQGFRVMCVWENHDQIETSNVTVVNNLVARYERRAERNRHRHIDYGLLRLWSEDFSIVEADLPCDLNVVVEQLVDKCLLRAWSVNQRFWEIGTPEGLASTELFLGSQKWGGLS